MLRVEAGLKQTDLASHAKVTPQFLSRVENEREGAEPSLGLLKRLCLHLGIPVEVLLLEAIDLPAGAPFEHRKVLDAVRLLAREYRRDWGDQVGAGRTGRVVASSRPRRPR
ncbi:MAG: helix-turn-helix domain-containing protein [Planctomycetes bacterium]|nr:helix-turn-helix domain-containing protein [Planctomycetota bacterium]